MPLASVITTTVGAFRSGKNVHFHFAGRVNVPATSSTTPAIITNSRLRNENSMIRFSMTRAVLVGVGVAFGDRPGERGHLDLRDAPADDRLAGRAGLRRLARTGLPSDGAQLHFPFGICPSSSSCTKTE